MRVIGGGEDSRRWGCLWENIRRDVDGESGFNLDVVILFLETAM